MSQRKISVVGLGYVGLPIAVAFARSGPVAGFDRNARRVEELRKGVDRTGEVPERELRSSQLTVSADPSVLRGADFHIIAVPTPVDAAKVPDLGALVSASETVGAHLKKGDIVVYESTVYPGATEEVCLPVLERASGLKSGDDFSVGYSPERINPGDRTHSFTDIVKVVSGQDPRTLEVVARVYGSVVKAGVHRATSIRVAEAAKVIENIQRDVNIALINELAVIFHELGIETADVLAASRSKWNFLPFVPGLVGGHCIGVDPYYMTHKAAMIGYTPQMILAGRRINDEMGRYVARETIKQLIGMGRSVKGATIAVLGLSFKEDVPDIRNSKVVDVIRELESYGVHVQVHDPVVSADDARAEYGIELKALDRLAPADAVVLAVSHAPFVEQGWDLVRPLLRGQKGLVADVKNQLDRAAVPPGILHWRL